MRSLTLRSFGLFGLLAFSAACATSAKSTDAKGASGDGTSGGSDTTVPDDPQTEPPHALGTITLGEARSSTTGDSAPVISAVFLPDASKAKSCTHKVGACEVTDIPQCKTGINPGCASGEICGFDDSCTAKCVKACSKSCGAGEECFFSSSAPSADQGMACRKRNRFDAGAIAFAGTTTSVTLFPPYAIKPDGNGAPFMPASEIRVQASGATQAGFEKFDEKFTSTTFVETDPPLSDLSRATVFGGGDVPISWVPGQDSVIVGVSGAAGSARCVADDTSGTFDLPRAVISDVLGSSSSASSVSITVTRQRREVRRDKKTLGTLTSGDVVEPVGWLELVTSSSETMSFSSCGTGGSFCNDQCVSLQADSTNCGACGKVCLPTQYCSSGACR